MKEDITKKIELQEGVKANLDGKTLVVSGPKGEVQRTFDHPKVNLSVEPDAVILHCSKGTKREKMLICSFEAHIKNMVCGVCEPHEYKLKICSGHFPMNVSVSGNELVVKNFLGESVPRKVKVVRDVQVKVNGDEILVLSSDKELAGQMASRIENACRITNRDCRIFQDGCYITQKAEKKIL